jgi:hypothetical protein
MNVAISFFCHSREGGNPGFCKTTAITRSIPANGIKSGVVESWTINGDCPTFSIVQYAFVKIKESIQDVDD